MELEDFIEKSKRRAISELEKSSKTNDMNEAYNSKLDMRINELVIEVDNLVKMKLVFKLDYARPCWCSHQQDYKPSNNLISYPIESLHFTKGNFIP